MEGAALPVCGGGEVQQASAARCGAVSAPLRWGPGRAVRRSAVRHLPDAGLLHRRGLALDLLVYASQGAVDSVVHRIRNTGKAIEVVSMVLTGDLTGSPQSALEQVQAIAEKVKEHRPGALAA